MGYRRTRIRGCPVGQAGVLIGGLPPFPSQGTAAGWRGTFPRMNFPSQSRQWIIKDDVVIAIHRPGEEWVVKAYDADARPDQGLPPTPEPKSTSRRR